MTASASTGETTALVRSQHVQNTGDRQREALRSGVRARRVPARPTTSSTRPISTASAALPVELSGQLPRPAGTGELSAIDCYFTGLPADLPRNAREREMIISHPPGEANLITLFGDLYLDTHELRRLNPHPLDYRRTLEASQPTLGLPPDQRPG